MGWVWRSHVRFCALCPHFHAQLVLPWPFGAAFQNTCAFNWFKFFFHFPVFFGLFLLRWCSFKIHFFLQHRSFSSAAVAVLLFLVFLKHSPAAQDALHPTSCSDVKLLIKQLRHSILRGKSGLLAPLGISVLMCSPFWNPPSIPSAPSLLASGKASALHLFVCTSKCSKGQNLCLWCSWIYYFVLLFLPDELHDRGEMAPKL